MYQVYKHTTPSGKVYIGITSRQHNTRWKKGKRIRCITTGQVFNTIKEAGEYFGVSSQNIGKACKGLLKHSGGMEWEYLEKENGK